MENFPPEVARFTDETFKVVEPEEMHMMTGYDEAIAEVLREDTIALEEGVTTYAYGHGREPLRFDDREFAAAIAWTESAGFQTMNDMDYHRIHLSFDSYLYPLREGEAVPQIYMRLVGNWMTREGDLSLVMDVPRGRGLKSYYELREITEREPTLPRALETIMAYVNRPVDKAALRNLPKEGAFPRMCEAYQHIYKLLTAVPEEEEMHMITGYDEARSKEVRNV